MRVTAVALVLGLLATRALAADQTILGNQFQLKSPSTPDKRGFVGKAKELGSANTIVGDPTLNGATLTVRADGGTPSSQTIPLPQGTALNGKPFWSGDAIKGFKYKDSKGEQGPIKSAQIKKTGSGVFLIKLKGSGKYMALTVVPPDPGTTGCILLEMGGGGDSYSVAFTTGIITNTDSRLFKVKKPTAEGTCVVPPTTSTVTTSSTSSTESTTSSTESTTSSTEATTSSTESTTSSTESTTSSTESTTSSTESTSTSTESTTSSTESTTSSTESTSTSSSTSSTESTSTSTSSSTSSSSSSSSSSTSSSTSSSSSSSSSSTSSSTSTSTSSTTTSTLSGPTLPPNVGGTGTITPSFSGAASPGDAGGRSVTFTCVDTTWTKLYWGSSSSAVPGAGLDGTLHTLSVSAASPTVEQWDASTSYTNPDTGATTTAAVRMLLTITAGGLSWALPPPGPPPGVPLVKVVDPAGTCSSFTVKVEFLGNVGSGFVALNTIRQGSGSLTTSSFTGAFYFVPG